MGLEYLHASKVRLVQVFETVLTFKGLQFVALVKEPLVNLAPFQPRCLNSIFTDFICDWSFQIVEYFGKGLNLPFRFSDTLLLNLMLHQFPVFVMEIINSHLFWLFGAF